MINLLLQFASSNPVSDKNPRELNRKHKMRENKTKLLNPEELRTQERHWMEMWKDSRTKLRQLRKDLREETDPDIKAEIEEDIEGLKRRKNDWSTLLGLNHELSDTQASL